MGWRIVGGVGRVLVTAGALILLFVAYQLWGTGLQEARAQDKLEDQFAEAQAKVAAANATSTTTTTSTTVPGSTAPVRVAPAPVAQKLPLPSPGAPVAKIMIPRIGITRTVVEGISTQQLGRGPGHYPESPLPGQKGNVAIAGHRTTYGQPFHNVDKLKAGDQVLFETLQGKFVYEVEGLEIVGPREVRVLEDRGDNRLTLIACHPKYSLKQRIIVHAKLVGKPAAPIEGQDELREKAGNSNDPFDIDSGASKKGSKAPAIAWGLAAAAVWFVCWLAQVFIRRRTNARTEDSPTRGQRLLSWSPYLVGVPVFLVVLYVFFENFARLLPAAY